MNPEKQKKRPGPAPRFTREAIIAASLKLIDEGPPDSFTMRRLADHLGVNPMTIYGYVTGKNDIVEAATLLAARQVHEEPDATAPWRDQLRCAVRDLYNVSVRHPNLARLVLGRRATAPGLFRNRERLLRLLLESGLDERRALQALGILTYYALGFGTGRAGFESLPELPADEFPSLTSVSGRYAEHVSDEAFETGLDHLINSLT